MVWMALKNNSAPLRLTCYTWPLSTLHPSLRASSPIWASETSRARTRERAAKPRGAGLARLASLAQIGELARRLPSPLCAIRNENEADSLGLRGAKRTSARKLLSHEQMVMSTLPPPSRVSVRYTVNHLASKHRFGLVSGCCPTLTGYREARKGLDVKSGSPLMKSYICPLDKLLHRVRIPGRLRHYDGDGNKVNSPSFKLHRDHASLLNLWIVRKLSWRWIIRDGIRQRKIR